MTEISWRWSWPGINVHLLVSQEVACLLKRFRQKNFDVEHGGQLFVDLSNPSGLVLALATPPHKDDRSGRHWLVLDAHRCHEEIKRANAAGLRLIGYWHTHPQNVPIISPTDIWVFSEFAARYAEGLPHPLAVIVGNSCKPDGIKAWSFREGRYIEAVWSGCIS